MDTLIDKEREFGCHLGLVVRKKDKQSEIEKKRQ